MSNRTKAIARRILARVLGRKVSSQTIKLAKVIANDTDGMTPGLANLIRAVANANPDRRLRLPVNHTLFTLAEGWLFGPMKPPSRKKGVQ